MTKIRYRGYTIYDADYPQHGAFEYVSDNYDGPGDNRHGQEATIEDCRAAIDEKILSNDHAKNCPCGECNADELYDRHMDEVLFGN